MNGLCNVYVALLPATMQVLGYFTLSASSIEVEALTLQAKKGLPKYSRYPSVLIGMLARDASVKGQGMGDYLLARAFMRIKASQQEVVYFGVELLAATPKLIKWYISFGFVVLKTMNDGKAMMFIHRKAIP